MGTELLFQQQSDGQWSSGHALAQLHAAEYEVMLRVAVVIVGSRFVAEEIVQDSFLGLEENWADVANPGGYLRGTVVSNSRSQLRRWAVERRHAGSSPGLSVEPEADVDQVAEVELALAGLNEQQRCAVVLRYFAGFSSEEIGEYLKCRPSTARSHIRRALSKMRNESS